MDRRADVPPPTGERLALLRRLGYGDLMHDSHVPFVSHLLGTRRLLVEWGERLALCDAGLFHSAYGTEYFQPEEPAGRDEVTALIGEEAEAIAWVWCTILRDTVDVADPWTALDRETGAPLTLGEQMITDVATLWAADTVEQIDRMAADERDFAAGLGRVLHLASPNARSAGEALLGYEGTLELLE